MESRRFDALTRLVARRASRRGTLRFGALAVLGAALVPDRAAADHCDYAGCGCSTGVRHACGRGLVCCPSSPGVPGGGGVCAPRDQCGGGGGCTGSGGACPGYCNWGDSCPDCCSGYCGPYGQCDTQACTGVGCSCTTGTYQPCDAGLVCCAIYADFPGGTGVCQYGCG